ncbi:MAG: hypothetical protein JKY65_02440 [Planctomycetes bacterium]|nr:hypothetical protein [Planctomycetota bacterium]
MKRGTLVAALAILLLLPGVALAGGKGDAAGAILFGPLFLALLLLPTGCALHALILAHAPRRGQALVQAAERHRWKTILLGVLNTGFVMFLVAATSKGAPPLAMIGLLAWILLVLVGSHGLARSLGARALGREQPSGPPGDLAEVSLGWTILVFGAAIPFVGLFLGAYWCVRATGAGILALLAVEIEVEVSPQKDVELKDGIQPPQD